MWVRVVSTTVLLVFAAACSDQLTEPRPDRTPATAAGTVAFATSESGDGLSITTDKDDYAPGDTVWFTGAGWPANDVLDIQLDDEPATHPPHTWTIAVLEDGTFRDSTYVVDVGDAGVTFTLTATSRTGRSLTVTFTDGSEGDVTNVTVTPVSISGGYKLQVNVDGSIGKNELWNTTSYQIQAAKPDNGSVPGTCIDKSPDVVGPTVGGNPPPVTGTHAFDIPGPFAPGSSGTVWIRIRRSDCATTSPSDGQWDETNGQFNIPAPASKLAFTTGAFIRVVGQCSPQITVQTQNASEAPTNPATAVTVNLTSNSVGGTFYSDAACSAANAITNVGIPTTENKASFYYKDSQAGTPTLTAADAATTNPLTSATQEETINLPPGPNKLAFTTSAFTRVVGQCSPQVTVQSRNASNAPTNPTGSDLTVDLASTSLGGTFYSDAGCANAVTSVSIPTSGNTASFYYKDAKAGSPKLTAAASGLTSAEQTETINKADQTITFDLSGLPTKTFGDDPFSVASYATGGASGNPVTFTSSTTGRCTVTAEGAVTILHAGQCTLKASQAGNDDYNAATDVVQSFQIQKANQTITFDLSGLPTKTFGDDPFSVAAYATEGGSGNPVTFTSSTTGKCTVTTAGLVTILHAGQCTLKASQAGNDDYNAAADVERSFEIQKAPQAIIFSLSSVSKTYGDAPFSVASFVTASGGSGNVVTFTSLTTGQCTATSAGQVTIVGAGTCTIRASQAGNDDYLDAPNVDQGFTIEKALLTVSILDAGQQPYSKSIYFADPVPPYTVNYSGFVYDENESVLTGASSIGFYLGGTKYDPPSAVGTYAITGNVSSPNYAITLNSGQLQILAWTLAGFYAPVDVPAGAIPWNTVKGGSTVPLKFEVFAGSRELTNPLSTVKPQPTGFIASGVTCPNNAVTDDIEFVTTGGTTLRYDGSAGQFIQNWQTPKKPNTCYKTTMTTQDGSSIFAYFILK